MLDLLCVMSFDELERQEDHARSVRGSRKDMESLKNLERSKTEVRRFDGPGSTSGKF